MINKAGVLFCTTPPFFYYKKHFLTQTPISEPKRIFTALCLSN